MRAGISAGLKLLPVRPGFCDAKSLALSIRA
jgi:hypothetical protein